MRCELGVDCTIEMRWELSRWAQRSLGRRDGGAYRVRITAIRGISECHSPNLTLEPSPCHHIRERLRRE